MGIRVSDNKGSLFPLRIVFVGLYWWGHSVYGNYQISHVRYIPPRALNFDRPWRDFHLEPVKRKSCSRSGSRSLGVFGLSGVAWPSQLSISKTS